MAGINLRRLGVLVVTVAALVTLVATNGSRPERLTPTFTELGQVSMPFAPTGTQLTGSWFCPGAPRDSGAGGTVVISNPTSGELQGWATVFSNEAGADPQRVRLAIPANSAYTVDLNDAQQSGTYLSALVELTGGAGLVEQRAINPAGNSVSACSNAAAGQWYFADGFTSGGSTEQLQITNPYADTAIVDVVIVTATGTRRPSGLQGMPIAAQSVGTVDLGAAAQNEDVLAATVTSSRGRVVAARVQTYRGGGRTGFSLTLGSPGLYDQYYFADNEVGAGIRTVYTIYNPNPTPIDVTVVPLDPGLDPELTQPTITVDAGGVRSVVMSKGSGSDLTGLPDARFGLVFATSLDTPANFLVEQARTRNGSTNVIPGIPGALVTQRWSMVVTPSGDVSDALRVFNVNNVDAYLTVKALGPDGFVDIPSLAKVDIAARGSVSLDFTDVPAELSGKPMLVDCTSCQIFVERELPRGHGLPGRTGSVPLNG